MALAPRPRWQTATPAEQAAEKAAREAKIAADIAQAIAHEPTGWTLPAAHGAEMTYLQGEYIAKLVDDKAWKAEVANDVDQLVRQHGLAEALRHIDATAAGRDALAAAARTDLTTVQASAVIDALKTW